MNDSSFARDLRALADDIDAHRASVFDPPDDDTVMRFGKLADDYGHEIELFEAQGLYADGEYIKAAEVLNVLADTLS